MGNQKYLSNFTSYLILLTVMYLNHNVAADRHVIDKRTFFTEPEKTYPGPQKNYTGYRVRKDSLLVLYHHEQTVGVVELGDNRELLNCELMEVKTNFDKLATLASLKSTVSKQAQIPFWDMMDLMHRCQFVEPVFLPRKIIFRKRPRQIDDHQRGITSIFKGLYPGTKWCGSGDEAETYYDLGSKKEVDKCCRNHDLCPVKIPGHKTQYNLTNSTPYTRVHCGCDDAFRRCLEDIGTKYSQLLETIYFTIARPVCVEDILETGSTKVIGRRFVSSRDRSD